jgi:putative ATP-dependent endonuclease of OLD family
MKIKKVEIQNFRILENVVIDLDDDITLIVGRNNSGKTSLTEIFYKFFSGDKSRFKFEDFSLSSHSSFVSANTLYTEYVAAKETEGTEDTLFEKQDLFKSALPKIATNIYIEYTDEDDGNLASLSNFIMDLDMDRKDALLSCEYSISDPERFFKVFTLNAAEYNNDIIEFIRKNLHFFEKKFYSVDSQNLESKSLIEKSSDIENIFLPRFITAQINVDDHSDDNSKGLSRGFESYYKHNRNEDEGAKKLKTSLDETAVELDGNYKVFFKSIFDDLENFGVNTGVNRKELELEIKSNFEVEKVLKNNANLFYRHEDEKLLPESYNGLGYSRLIFILLSILGYYEEQFKRKTPPNFSLLFIEEPEAHLHPQMQQTFIKNIRDFIKKKKWKVQIIITTHSSHIVADCGFEGIRYFDKSEKKIDVKNLTEFKTNVVKKEGHDETIKFLKQYMTLYNCDMFFADKIILVEGTVERLLLPEMIKKEAKELINQYLTVIEVGGAYAHNFREILEFINVKTLIITDIDAIDKSKNRSACPVDTGANILTSNQTLVKWLPKKEQIAELLSCLEEHKADKKSRVAFQIPEAAGGKCGRSFEEAFIIKNASVFSSNTKDISTINLFKTKEKTANKTAEVIISESYTIAGQIPKKTDFAFDIIRLDTWEVPTYIKEGLVWLQN